MAPPAIDIGLPRPQLWHELWTGSSTAAQLIRYTLVGGFAFICDFFTLSALTELGGLHYLWSGALAFLVGLAVNYGLSVRFVFHTRRVRDRRVEFAVFAAIGVVGLGLNELLLWSFTELCGLHYLGSKLAATGTAYVWNFFARKLSLFSSRGQRAA